MNKHLKVITIFSLLFYNMAFTHDAVSRASVQGIEEKKDCYQKIEDDAKQFRRTVYILAAISATSLLGFLSYKIYRHYNGKSDEDQKKIGASSSGSYKSSGKYYDLKKVPKNYLLKLKRRNKKFLGLCKERLYDGITDGAYWAISSVFITSGMTAASGAYVLGKNKFSKAWNGNNIETFESIKRQLDFELEQFRSFFMPGFYDKQEIKDNHNYFVQIVENFLSLVTVLAEQKEGLGQAEQEVVLNGQDLLMARVNKFAETLESSLNNIQGDEVDQELLQEIYVSFNQLHNQMVRFINICCSILYENV